MDVYEESAAYFTFLARCGLSSKSNYPSESPFFDAGEQRDGFQTEKFRCPAGAKKLSSQYLLKRI